MNGPVLIVGASGRAAAASAFRASLQPHILDLFEDEDTKRLGPTLRCPIDEYPHGFIELAKRFPPMPWMYTGGLENYPDVVEAISKARTLWGTSTETLKVVREPEFLKRMAEPLDFVSPTRARGVQSLFDPSLARRANKIQWLRKPLRGSGGIGIRFATEEDFDALRPGCGFQIQEFIEGESHSALFRSDEYGHVLYLGSSRQLVGEDWLHAPGFQYAGNILNRDEPNREQLISLATAIVVSVPPPGLAGLWGIDFLRCDGRIAALEINPRYPASVEIFERASGVSAYRTPTTPIPNRVVGKAIYYAARDFEFPKLELENCADTPAAGSRISTGQPVLTLFAEADTEPECLRCLKKLSAAFDLQFGE